MSRSLRLLLVAALFAAILYPVAVAAADTHCDIIGTEDDDVLVGTDADEVICGLGGDDVIRAGRGNDVIYAGAGDDRIFAGPGHDIVRAGPGDDDIRGQNGRDRLFGQIGQDRIDGGAGRDRLRGGPGLDTCTDPRGATRESGCETPNQQAQARWAALEIGEYVFELVSGDETLLIRVRDGAVVVPNAEVGESIPDAEAVIAGASEVDDVVYDAVTGLPDRTRVDDGEWALTRFERRDELRAAHDRATSIWAEADIADYAFVVETICFCEGIVDVDVRVESGEVVSITDAATGETIAEPFGPETLTVGEHLAAIGSLLDGAAVSVSAEFDEVFGVPKTYAYDLSSIIADEEAAVEITDFAVIDPDGAPDDDGPGLDPLQTVRVGGIEVADTIAENVGALLEAAAADGFTLSGGGYRDPARQIELRRINCGPTDYDIFEKPASECSPPTAIPGRSLHEQGLAIDFTNDGRLITSRTDPAYLWLVENAETFGLFNHPAEPWHWSVNGN